MMHIRQTLLLILTEVISDEDIIGVHVVLYAIGVFVGASEVIEAQKGIGTGIPSAIVPDDAEASRLMHVEVLETEVMEVQEVLARTVVCLRLVVGEGCGY